MKDCRDSRCVSGIDGIRSEKLVKNWLAFAKVPPRTFNGLSCVLYLVIKMHTAHFKRYEDTTGQMRMMGGGKGRRPVLAWFEK